MRIAIAAVATLAVCSAAYAQDLQWLDSLDKAKEAGKPVAFLRILGKLDGKL